MIKAIRYLTNSLRDKRNAMKKTNVTQATQVMPSQNLEPDKLEKRNGEDASNPFGVSPDAKKQKGLSRQKAKSDKIGKVVEAVAPTSMNIRKEPQRHEPRSAKSDT